MKVFSDPTDGFFEILTRYPAPPPPLESTAVNPYSTPSRRPVNIGKRKEAEEISRLNDAMNQIIAKTEEYKKDLLAKKKQLEEMNTANGTAE
jgi:hypothetical protein